MSEKLLQHLPALCNTVRRIAVEAGHATLEYFDEAGFSGAQTKGDGSPVTIADRAAEAVIEKALRELMPEIPLIAEEAAAEGRLPDLQGREYFWLADPLDGTKEFITGSGDYTVNIALIRNGEPIVGVVYAPAAGELYAGCGPGTAIRWLEKTGVEKNIHVRAAPAEGLIVAASRNHGDPQRLDSFLGNYKVARLIKRGSSLKICAVASGKADIYPRFGPTSEWDTAAGDAVLRSAGGVMTDMAGKNLTYGRQREKFLNPEFIAAGLDFPLYL
jgi:3'(2'), 5'-bisphosphate nucleotidase